MSYLDHITVACTKLTGEIYLGRVSSDGKKFVSKRSATSEVMVAAIDHILHDSPNGAILSVEHRFKAWEVEVRPSGKPACGEVTAGDVAAWARAVGHRLGTDEAHLVTDEEATLANAIATALQKLEAKK